MDFLQSLAQKGSDFERYLEQYRFVAQPAILSDAMNYALFSPGKRFRPVLMLESCAALGGDREDCIPLAVGVEMVHSYSLVHDDLPCMDDDDLRRGMPTCHIAFGYANAVLAGDGLLNGAYEAMAGAYFESKNKSAYMKAFAEIAQASGSKGMVAGQAADMAGTAGGASAQAVEFIHSSKTGALIKACAAAGAIMSGSGEAGCEMLAKYGGIVGLMYQIADDIIDATASEAEAGKRTGKDAEAEKITYPLVYGLAGAKEQLRSLCSEAVAAISPLGSPGNFLKETALYLLGSADRIEEPI